MKSAALKFAFFFATVMIFAGCSSNPPRHPSVVISGGMNVTPGQTITLTATVSNDKTGAGVTWSVTGAGTFTSTDTTLTYTAPGAIPENPVVMVTATTNATPTSTETISFSIVSGVAPSLSFLNGPYAFELSGFDRNGGALTLAGSFVADGLGNITSGEIDENDNFNISNATNITGTYTLGSDLRGVITLNAALNAFSDGPTFAFTIDSATNTGSIISADSEEQAVSGLLAGQTPAAFSSTPTGSFIFRGTSDATNVRSGMVGRFTVGAGGLISAGLVDSADIGNGNDAQNGPFNGTFSASDLFGRGTITVSQGQSQVGAGLYAYYAVSATKLFMVEIGPEDLDQFVVVARTQSALTANSVNGTGVFGLIGADDGENTETVPFAAAAIGQLVVTGGTAATFNCDVNDAGDVSQCNLNNIPGPIPGVVAFDPSTGRGTITIANGFSDGFVDSLVFYLEATGTGVMMDTTAVGGVDSSFPEAFVGDLIPQTSTADITGQVQGLGLTADIGSVAITGEFNVAQDLTISGLFDGSLPDSAPLLDSVTGGMVGASDTTGRAVIQVSGDVFGGMLQPAAAYEANPTQYFVIAENSGFTSGLGIFTPQTLPQVQNGARPAKQADKTGKVLPRRPVPAARQHKRLHAANPNPPQAR